jgi:hypothetical protein
MNWNDLNKQYAWAELCRLAKLQEEASERAKAMVTATVTSNRTLSSLDSLIAERQAKQPKWHLVK